MSSRHCCRYGFCKKSANRGSVCEIARQAWHGGRAKWTNGNYFCVAVGPVKRRWTGRVRREGTVT